MKVGERGTGRTRGCQGSEARHTRVYKLTTGSVRLATQKPLSKPRNRAKMRREGRQRGWVRVYDRELVDPEGKRRAVHVVDGQVVANGGFIRAPRKPTNQSKSGGRRALLALGRKSIAKEVEETQVHPPAPAAGYGYYSTGWPSSFRYRDAVVQEEARARRPAATRSGGRTSCKGSRDNLRKNLKGICYFYGDELDYLEDDFDS
uniref:Uncharacterized protein n=1 Tax=Avena sativa TaxID=4498 RepID=A0ACD5VSN7_AVESA